MRKYTLLNQNWQFTKENHTETVQLPHSWNALDGQDGGDNYYRGECTYTKEIAYTPKVGNRLFLEFRGVSSEAEVLVNGTYVGKHEGGYSTFRFDVTDCWRETNTLAVKVSNMPNNRVYPQTADFTF